MKRAIIGLAAAFALTGAAHATDIGQFPDPVAFDKSAAMKMAEKVADYHIVSMAAGVIPSGMNNVPDPRGWIQGAFFVGLRELAEHSQEPRYGQLILSRGQVNKWELGPRLYHADDHVIGQAYFYARSADGYVRSAYGMEDKAIAPMRAAFDKILAAPSKVDLWHAEYNAPGGVVCADRWCWSDALFMSPPAWFEMAKVTGDKRYYDFAKAEFLAATDYMFDKQEHLYFRDSRFFEKRGPDGEKMFWSRGNGWAYAGLARIIPMMPDSDPDKAKFINIFRQMSAKLKAIQKPDGYWSPSLLSNPKTSLPETSGTGFFTYGLAWGVKAGILNRTEYEPTIRKGWTALVRAVHLDGHLGWVQTVSDQPNNVNYNDTQYYGVGAFLLAATAVSELSLK